MRLKGIPLRKSLCPSCTFLFICTELTAEELSGHEGEEENISISAADGEELAVSWLNELLFRMETRSEVFIAQNIKISMSLQHSRQRQEGPHGIRFPPVKARHLRRNGTSPYPPFLRIFGYLNGGDKNEKVS